MTASNDSPPEPTTDRSRTEPNGTSVDSRSGVSGRPSAVRRAFDAGVIIAVAGLVFSGVTYFFNRRDQENADQRGARTELTQTVEQMAALPRQYPTLLDGPITAADSNTLSHYRSELLVLATQAERIISEHPSIARQADFLEIGQAEDDIGDGYTALTNYLRSEKLALDANDSVVGQASRLSLGESLFNLRQFDAGRKWFRRAVSLTGFHDVPNPKRKDASGLRAIYVGSSCGRERTVRGSDREVERTC